MDKSLIIKAAELISKARCAIALTGAGVSVASGIPDFRSPGGLWSRHDPQKVASIKALESDPATVWKFLLEAHLMMGKANPNPAHRAFADLEKRGCIHGVVTQNIDGLHQSAGSETVVEFHGNCCRFYCMYCYAPYDESKIDGNSLPVRCGECGGVVRPDLVFFGERIDPDVHAAAFELAGQSDLVIVAGTSGEVVPASLIPPLIQGGGGKIIEINMSPSAYTSVSDVFLQGAVEMILPEIVQNIIK